MVASGQVGKAPVSGTGDRRFESYLASQGIITDKKPGNLLWLFVLSEISNL